MNKFKEKLVLKALSNIEQECPILAPYLAQVDRYDAAFILQKLSSFPHIIKSTILFQAFNKPTPVERNRHILATTKTLFALLPAKLAHLFFCSDDEISLKAKECASYCRQIAISPEKVNFIHYQALHAQRNESEFKLTSSLSFRTANSTNSETNSENFAPIRPTTKEFNSEFALAKQKSLYEYLSNFAMNIGVSPISIENNIEFVGCIKRYSDNRWWLRRIRKLINQANEKAAIHLNFVNSKRQIYASDVTTRNRIAQHTRNENLLSSTYILNEQGQRYSLKEISDLNVSNPKIRKDELLCRARGFENLAKDLGHEALFITVTCPSKYHRAFSKSGAPNPKWQGLMPDQANSYLNQQWQKARAEFKRQNIAPYGFRVAEPQHDGTPHWHMLFFIEGEKLEALKAIIRHYALEVDGDEKGAAENRCDFKHIDPNKGSATGYILKYIAKNIDGEGVGEDKFGNDSLLVAQRIDAWASCWCIRQFQQIGGASVSVWRELRRLRSMFKGESNSLLEQARSAADNSDWQAYTQAMGGLNIKSKDRPIKLHYDVNVNEETGECSQSYYDGELIQKVKGLWFAGKTFVTRFYQWRLEKA